MLFTLLNLFYIKLVLFLNCLVRSLKDRRTERQGLCKVGQQRCLKIKCQHSWNENKKNEQSAENTFLHFCPYSPYGQTRLKCNVCDPQYVKKLGIFIKNAIRKKTLNAKKKCIGVPPAQGWPGLPYIWYIQCNRV